MTSIAKWGDIGAWTSALSNANDLNSIATNTAIAVGPAITNGTSKDLLMDLSLQLGSFNASAGSPFFEVHLLPLLADGTTYADRGNATFVGSLAIVAGTSVKNAAMLGIPIPPGDYELQIVNQTGGTTAASANTFKRRLYAVDLNG